MTKAGDSSQGGSLTRARDLELMTRVADGDRAAFTEVMRANEDMVFGVCLRLLRDREAALDATQETFVTVYRKADRYRGDAALSTWLYRVAVNTCYDLMRKQRRRAADPLPDYYDPADPAGEDSFVSVDLRPSVEDALQALPEDFRAAVVLSDIEGLALAEISTILDVPVGTVKSRIFRGRRLLAQSLGNLVDPSKHPTDEDHA